MRAEATGYLFPVEGLMNPPKHNEILQHKIAALLKTFVKTNWIKINATFRSMYVDKILGNKINVLESLKIPQTYIPQKLCGKF